MDVNQAVAAAKSYVQHVYDATGELVSGLRLEEVEKTGDQWLVTVAFSRPEPEAEGLVAQIRGLTRYVKQLTVEPDGSVVAMRNVNSGR